MSEKSEVDGVADRAGAIVEALTGVYLTAAEVAAERIELASQAAQVRVRTAALAAVLEGLDGQKTAMLERMASASPAVRRLLEHQVETLAAQEVAVLTLAGVPQPAPPEALASVAGGSTPVAPRNGRRRT